MNMLRAQRDANILKSTGHITKGSKSTSSATSDDSSSTDTDSSDSSSDADADADVRNSDEDDFDSVNKNGSENKPTDNTQASVLNKIQVNGISLSNNIPHDIDLKFLENLSTNTRDSITRLIDYSKNLKEKFFQPETVDLLYEYAKKKQQTFIKCKGLIYVGFDIFRIIKAHQSDSKLQNHIYSYLEQLTPYSKQHLMNEVTEYAIKKNENEVRTQERILQKEINQMMPVIKEKYDIDVKKIDQQRATYQGNEKPEHLFRYPRRKFPWNDSLRYSVLFLLFSRHLNVNISFLIDPA